MENKIYLKEHLGNNIFVYVSREHTFNTDSVLLADFAGVGKKDICCDLGTGCGIIPLIWCAKDMADRITAVEIQKNACKQFEKSITENKLENKICLINGDIRKISELSDRGKFSVVTMNPPYFSENSGEKSPDESTKIARHEVMCNIFDASECAAYLLKYGGKFCICHRPERLCDIFEAMRKNGIEPKRIRVVSRNREKLPWLVLVEGRKGGKSGLKFERPLVMTDEDGNYTDEIRKIYGDYAAF